MNSTEEKTITFLISTLSGGGAEGVCVNLANLLAEEGWKVTLIVLHLNNSINRQKLIPAVNLISLDVLNARKSIGPLSKQLLLIKPKRILVFNYELAIIALFINKIFRLKIKIIARNINRFSK